MRFQKREKPSDKTLLVGDGWVKVETWVPCTECRGAGIFRASPQSFLAFDPCKTCDRVGYKKVVRRKKTFLCVGGPSNGSILTNDQAKHYSLYNCGKQLKSRQPDGTIIKRKPSSLLVWNEILGLRVRLPEVRYY